MTITPSQQSSAINIVATDPHYDLVSWAKEKADAQAMADAHYFNAVLYKKDDYKIAFFDSVKRVKDIERAIDKYLGVN